MSPLLQDPVTEERDEPTNFVDEEALVAKWRRDDPLQWWDDYDDTPGIEAWTDMRPTSKRKGEVPGAAEIKRQGQENAATTTGTAVKAREGSGVTEPQPKGDWLDIAKSQIGSPYVWADSDPKGGGSTGFDCSGFTAWVYSEAFGVALPHLSSAQMTSTQRVSRENLRPGDLIFFHYSDRNGAGAADHVEIYVGGNKSIGTPDGNTGVGLQNVDWDAFIGGGRVDGVETQRAAPQMTEPTREKKKFGRNTGYFDQTLVPVSMGYQTNLADATVGLFMDADREVGGERGKKDAPEFKGDKSQIQQQLYRGFVDAGRADLAKMVGTKDFETWIDAESGWNPNSVSQYFQGHGRNAGLFQFAFLSRDWVTKDVSHTQGDWVYTATPYEQARSVAQFFSLTPGDIKRYAQEIRNGTYSGWG